MKRAGEGRRGRPRREEVDRAITTAVLETIFERGLPAVTMEGIARRARVAKTTIYRRWPTRDAMVTAALSTTFTGFERPDTGDVREDLRQLVATRSDFFVEQPGVPGVARLILSVAADRRYWRNMMEPRRQTVRQVLERGQARGEIRPDVDLDLAVDLIIGPVIFAVLDQTRPLNRAFMNDVMEAALEGIACHLCSQTHSK